MAIDPTQRSSQLREPSQLSLAATEWNGLGRGLRDHRTRRPPRTWASRRSLRDRLAGPTSVALDPSGAAAPRSPSARYSCRSIPALVLHIQRVLKSRSNGCRLAASRMASYATVRAPTESAVGRQCIHHTRTPPAAAHGWQPRTLFVVIEHSAPPTSASRSIARYEVGQSTRVDTTRR